MSMDAGIVRSWRSDLGNVIVAARAFEAGELVFREAPLMYTEENDEQLGDLRTCHKLLKLRTYVRGTDASIDFSQQMLAFLNSPSVTQQKVLDMFCPDIELSRTHHVFVQAAEEYALQLLRLGTRMSSALHLADYAVLLPLLVTVSTDIDNSISLSVATILLRWMCNAHALDTGGIGLFESGSLVTHSCDGNLRYSCKSGGGTSLASFHATMSIAAGTILTSSYLGSDENVMMSTRQRQKILWDTKLFICTCPRCSSHSDPYRSIHCPGCSSSSSSSRSSIEVSFSHAPGTHTNVSLTQGTSNSGYISSTSPVQQVFQRSPPRAKRAFCVLTVPPSSSSSSSSTPHFNSTPSTSIQHHQDPTHAAHILARETKSTAVWLCDTCNKTLSQPEMRAVLAAASAMLSPSNSVFNIGRGSEAESTGVDVESELEGEVFSISEQINCYGRLVDPADLAMLQGRCQLLLGERHWTWHCLGYALTELWTAQLKASCEDAVNAFAESAAAAAVAEAATSAARDAAAQDEADAAEIAAADEAAATAAAAAAAVPVRIKGFSWETAPPTHSPLWSVVAESASEVEGPAVTQQALMSTLTASVDVAALDATGSTPAPTPPPQTEPLAEDALCNEFEVPSRLTEDALQRESLKGLSTFEQSDFVSEGAARAAEAYTVTPLMTASSAAAAEAAAAGSLISKSEPEHPNLQLLQKPMDAVLPVSTNASEGMLLTVAHSSARPPAQASAELVVFSAVALDVVYEVAVAFSELNFQIGCMFSEAVQIGFKDTPKPTHKPAHHTARSQQPCITTSNHSSSSGSISIDANLQTGRSTCVDAPASETAIDGSSAPQVSSHNRHNQLPAAGNGSAAAAMHVKPRVHAQRRECDRRAAAICAQLQASWAYLQQHTHDEPELVLKACAGPAAIVLLEASELELLSRPEPRLQAVRTAHYTASRLCDFYAKHPFQDLDSSLPRLEVVRETCQLLLKEERTKQI